MELYQIRYFLAVADTLNFTRASERSFVSQPALTKAIQRLEEAIGGRLFDRHESHADGAPVYRKRKRPGSARHVRSQDLLPTFRR